MQSLTKRSKVVVKKEMTFTEKLYLPAILNGMRITFSHLFKKSATIKYPEHVRPRAEVYRGQHVLKRDEAGAERCTACGLCAVACPAEAITMVAAERKKGEEHLYREEKYAAVYEINMLRCIFCGLCEEACPKEAIFLTDRIVDSEFERNDFVYGKDILVEGVESDKRIDISVRQNAETLEFKKHAEFGHNQTWDPNKSIQKAKSGH
jgi:NADH-quinone oxidoreductase subunit I